VQLAIKMLQISREELGDIIRDEILNNPILEDAVETASE
jgi:DNA-directed RNA polymerase specialized sigma54-like protein